MVTPGLGFLYNNFLGHYNPLPNQWDSIVPGKRGVGTTPTIVYRDGKPFLGVGAPGGSRINTAVFQTILNIVQRGVTVDEAVSAPPTRWCAAPWFCRTGWARPRPWP